MYSRDELTRRNAKLCGTKLFGLGLDWARRKYYPQSLFLGRPTIGELVEGMEIEARAAAERFLELVATRDEWDDSDDIGDIMLAQEHQNLRDLFWALPRDMTADYFRGLDARSFVEIAWGVSDDRESD